MLKGQLFDTTSRIAFAPDGGAGGQPSAATLQQVNMQARQLVTQAGIDMWQAIYTNTITTGPGSVLNIPIRNVGLIKRFMVEIRAIVAGSAGPTHTLQPLGPANFFSQVVFTDLSNQTRINTAGWHLMAVSTAKRRNVFGSAQTTDTPLGYGNNFTQVMQAPSTITATAASPNVFAMFEIPIAYSDRDLRGAIYANVTNATMNLQLTVNPNMFAINTVTDAVLAMYKSSTGVLPTLPSFQITVYQNYLDQLPQGKNGVILPMLDLSTAYLLNNTSVSGLVANQDNPIPYANYRDFMSTTLIYDNSGVLNTGSDINYAALQSANYTNIFKLDPYMAALMARLTIGDDYPVGTYYFDHRNKPISTIQYGNMQLVINPSTVTGSGSVFYVGYESLALINMITQAGSLYGN